MKSVFMCVNYPQYNPAIGISKKINDQIETFENMGYEVYYSAYTNKGIGIFCGNKILSETIYSQGKFDHYLRRFRLIKKCCRFIENRKFDLGFVRWDAADRQFIDVLRMMDKNCEKVLMDFHGYFPDFKPDGLKGWYIAVTNVINSRFFERYVDLGLTETKCQKVYGVDAVMMDTCIDVNKYKPHHYTGDCDSLNMISVANERDYHGYDRVILGISAYVKNGGKNNIRLHLVGDMSERTVQLISSLGLSDIVILHGYKTGTELEEIYNECNIGIGPLAPHRVGGKEGTGIKTKEYFALGLPYYYAGKELLVPDNYPYVMQIPANDDPVDIESIVCFYKNIRMDSNMQKNMRDFARENYSWEKVFRKALEELKKQ